MSVSYGGDSITFADGSVNSSGFIGHRNRIINGAMMVDQRNAGVEVNPAVQGVYYLDRWIAASSVASKFKIGQNAGAVTPPAGFINYLGCTSLSSYTVGAGETYVVQQRIEGLNIADLAWGTASAATVTLSFWVRSSLTGTFGGALRNSAADRSYPFTYTINQANTWEKETITIPGDTTGTWLTTNGIGVSVIFSIGTGATAAGPAGAWAATNYTGATGAVSVVGTSGATFYITGVQLERGSTASSFEYRSYGTELALCQRYYYKQQAVGTSDFFGGGQCTGTTTVVGISNFPTTMRTSPIALEQTGTAANYATYTGAGATTACSAVPSFVLASVWQGTSLFTVASGLTTGQAAAMRSNNAAAYLGWSAEL